MRLYDLGREKLLLCGQANQKILLGKILITSKVSFMRNGGTLYLMLFLLRFLET